MPVKDREKQREHGRNHYRKNKAKVQLKVRARDKIVTALTRATIVQYLKTHPCVDCGEKDSVVLEFDHRPGSGKLFSVSEAIRRKCSLAKVMAEIAKCDVRCANCHRRITYKRAGWTHKD